MVDAGPFLVEVAAGWEVPLGADTRVCLRLWKAGGKGTGSRGTEDCVL